MILPSIFGDSGEEFGTTGEALAVLVFMLSEFSAGTMAY